MVTEAQSKVINLWLIAGRLISRNYLLLYVKTKDNRLFTSTLNLWIVDAKTKKQGLSSEVLHRISLLFKLQHSFCSQWQNEGKLHFKHPMQGLRRESPKENLSSWMFQSFSIKICNWKQLMRCLECKMIDFINQLAPNKYVPLAIVKQIITYYLCNFNRYKIWGS